MKVEPKNNPMRTQKYIQVEAIVAKYKNLANQSKEVKEYRSNSPKGSFDIPIDYEREYFDQQLLAHFYFASAGDSVSKIVEKEYNTFEEYYLRGILSKEEETLLTENFEMLAEVIFSSPNEWPIERFGDTASPEEWSELIPHLLFSQGCEKVFIPESHLGEELKGISAKTIVTKSTDSLLRGFSMGLQMEYFESERKEGTLWESISDGSFDAACVGIDSSEPKLDELFDATYRIVREGGQILFCIPKSLLLDEASKMIRQQIKDEKILSEAISLPSGAVLLHIVKAEQSTFVMGNAVDICRHTSSKGRKRIDVNSFCLLAKNADLSEFDAHPYFRRFAYDSLRAEMLLPQFYLDFQAKGSSIQKISKLASDSISTYACSSDELVITVNNLSKVYAKSEVTFGKLKTIDLEHNRNYWRVSTPCVVMAVSEGGIAVGYVKEEGSLLVPHNLYALLPNEGVSVEYLACLLLSDSVARSISMLSYGSSLFFDKLPACWNQVIKVTEHNTEEQRDFVSKTILSDFSDTEKIAIAAGQSYMRAIHLRKHALSQNIAAFSSNFGSLLYLFKEKKGKLNATDKLSPISEMTVGDVFAILKGDLQDINERVENLAQEQDWNRFGKCDILEPQELIESYEDSHKSTNFSFEHSWENWEHNCFSKDILDPKTGKFLFHEGEAVKAAWFPKKALMQVFDNIVSNARSHGFVDEDRNDYRIRFDWSTDGLNMLIKISNNGSPIPTDMDSSLVFEYGYSSALNEGGHGGLGGGEIAEIMRKYNGDAKILSTPAEEFTVTYELTLPLASLY